MDLEQTHGCYPLLQWKHGEVLPTDLAVEEHPEGGANALNLNRCFLSLSLSHILGHDHKTLMTLMEVNNFQLCQLLNPQVS
jgi:hypothetical protein